MFCPKCKKKYEISPGNPVYPIHCMGKCGVTLIKEKKKKKKKSFVSMLFEIFGLGN